MNINEAMKEILELREELRKVRECYANDAVKLAWWNDLFQGKSINEVRCLAGQQQTTRHCKGRCGLDKPLEEFPTNRVAYRKIDGTKVHYTYRKNICRCCKNADRRERYAIEASPYNQTPDDSLEANLPDWLNPVRYENIAGMISEDV